MVDGVEFVGIVREARFEREGTAAGGDAGCAEEGLGD